MAALNKDVSQGELQQAMPGVSDATSFLFFVFKLGNEV
jgi:hypothetical protein